MIRVKSLHTYPLKSAQGIGHNSIEVTPRGLARDRLWVLANPDGVYLTQRQNAKMATIATAFLPDGSLQFGAPGHAPIAVSEPDTGALPRQSIRVWEDTCDAVAGPAEASSWFSDVLGQPVRLMRIADDFVRQTDLQFSLSGDHTGFADGFPLLVTSQNSFDSLSSYFTGTVGMERVRPNIVFEGAEPFAEDLIRRIRTSGGVELEFCKPCKRCEMPAIDQKTGDRAPNGLPTALAQKRFAAFSGSRGCFFGENALPRNLGIIKVGDEIEILETKPLSLAPMSSKRFYSPGYKP